MATHAAGFRRCATQQPSTGDRQRIANFENEYLQNVPEAALDLVIPLVFIHITDGAAGVVSPERRRRQVDILNTAYQTLGIRFRFNEAETRFVAARAAEAATPPLTIDARAAEAQQQRENFRTVKGGKMDEPGFTEAAFM
jgi:hypothetical protein